MGNKELKVLELFSGIRATSEALNRANIPHKTMTVEFENKVQEVANKLWGTDEPTRDVTKFENSWLPEDWNGTADLVVGGFPCQPFSIAGKQQGFDDEKGRGKLYQDTLRVIEMTNPTYVILENVKAIMNKKHSWIIDEIRETLEKMGYFVNIQVINAKDYIPQNRERVFIMASKIEQPKDIVKKEHNFVLKDFLEENVDELYYIDHDKKDNTRPKTLLEFLVLNPDEQEEYLRYLKDWKQEKRKWLNSQHYIGPESINHKGGTDGTNRYYKDNATHKGALLASSPGKIVEGFGEIEEEDFDIKKLLIENKLRLRNITPREAMRLQGWRDDQIDKVVDLPKGKIYHTAGNSMAIPVMEDIVRNLIK